MKRIKSVTVIVSIFLFAFMVSLSSVFAGSLTATNGYHKFDERWKDYKNKGNAKITYGFNKKGIDEDYVWAEHSKNSHYPSIYQRYNDKWYTGKSKKAGKTAKIEVRHKGSSIKYRCSW